MAKSIQITLQDEDYQEAKAMADMRHWEVERWIEFSLRHVARCVDHSSKYRKRTPWAETEKWLEEEVWPENHPTPDEVDRMLREQLLRELEDKAQK